MGKHWSRVLGERGPPGDQWWWGYCLKQLNKAPSSTTARHLAAAPRPSPALGLTSAAAIDVDGDIDLTADDEVDDERAQATAAAAEAAEEEELAALAAAEPMPTSVEGFKKHPRFCLARHVGKFQLVRPPSSSSSSSSPSSSVGVGVGVTAGYFRGEVVYHRRCVAELRTSTQWRKDMKQVST
jgi:hypothetical protein